MVIAPVYEQDRLVVPQGAVLSGLVEGVDRLGFGIKHPSARINYRFTSLEFPDGTVSRLEARTQEVETGREHVTPGGDIRGINPEANLSSGASVLISALIANIDFSVPALGLKFLIARSPDAEIYFPAGTELILRVTTDTTIEDLPGPQNVPALDEAEERKAETLLAAVPVQSFLAPNRPSDLVNVMLFGTRGQIARAFRAAGWDGEQNHSPLAAYRMYHCLVQRTGYSMAPMARLRLNGQKPDALYQKSLDTFAKRHHIRLWQQGQSDAWIGATTQDISYAFRGMHMTHAIDEDIDNERAKVVNDLWLTGCVSAASVVPRTGGMQYESVGYPISTDGGVAVLRLNDCDTPLATWMTPIRSQSFRQFTLRRMLVAIGNDLSHSNPVTVAYTLAKNILSGSTLQAANGFHGGAGRGVRRRTSLGESASSHRWKRPSVTDPAMSASPLLTATYLH